MNDHNLDDLIIDSIEPNHSKTKSFLTIVALFIVFLIAGIILAKIYTKESNNATLTLEENNSELIAPELKLQETPSKVAKTKEEPSLSAIREQEIEALEVKAPEVKTPEIKTKEIIPIQKPIETPKETEQITQELTKTTQEPEITAPVVKEAEIPKPIVNNNVPKAVEIVVVPKEIPKTVKEVVTPKEISKPLKKVVIPKKPANPVADSTYYIQVGSFTQSPSTRFLSVIKNSGFNYTVTKATAKGTKKLLIGPYPNRAAVDAALIQVRDRINKKSFVLKK